MGTHAAPHISAGFNSKPWGHNLDTSTVVDLLEKWGAWEMDGKNSHLKKLGYGSNFSDGAGLKLGSSGTWVRCQVSDDLGYRLFTLMSRVKREKPHHYAVLYLVHAEKDGSVRRLSVQLTHIDKRRVSRDEADKRYQHALGYVEAVFEDNDIDRLVG